ncbi:S66 peptidase family protein [Vampirovibrio chlorellavorus]|uniref:S66 peptidase family protein n=1 Tax=Vampirovibrio chlorellavorus TaxID=758823 RepID=UPI0026F1D417|nr:LD-carboxypeptidase [Vampirovibrio chlorellavorus]
MIPTKAPALQPGDTIAILSPAGATPIEPADSAKPDPFDQGVALLAQAGFRVKLMPNAKNKRLYLAGTDAERLSDLQAAFADPAVKGILCARGGYGCTRLLPQLDFALIQQNPKVFIGFSDITALLLPIYQQTGLMGFYGPMLTSNLIHNEPYSQSQLLQMVQGQNQAPYRIPNQNTYQCFQPGVAQGRLMGGNLSLLTALCGTPFQPRTDGHILFIEDWHEKYYTLDRQFQQLRMAGLLDGIAGLLLADFSEIETEPEQTLPAFLQELTGFLKVPVGFGFSVGHGEQTATLPIGCLAEFNATTGTLRLLENPVSL